MTNILAIDTCNNFCSVGLYSVDLYDSEKIITSDISNYKENTQSFSLINMIDSILSSNNLNIRQIEKIIITNGPGSFTGIRVGLSFGIGLQISTNIKIITINNLAAYYIDLFEQTKNRKKFLVINRATRQNLYYQYFENLLPITQTLSIQENKLNEIISDKNLIITGNNSTLQNKLPNYIYKDKIKMSNIAKFLANHNEKFITNLFDYSSILEAIYLREAIT